MRDAVAEIQLAAHRLVTLPGLVVGTCGFGPLLPARSHAQRANSERELLDAGEDRELGPVDAAELLCPGVDVDERLSADERVAGRRHLAEPRTDDEQQVGVTHALCQLRIDADAGVAD